MAQIQAARVERTLTTTVKPYSPHKPHPIQQLFLRLDDPEAFYGGAAGGGKSDALILAALQYVDVPGYSAALFRRTEIDLLKPGNILDRAKSWFAGTAAKWESDINGFRFPSYSSTPGATIHFGYGQRFEQLSVAYQGPEFQFIGIDELTQWDERCYRYLFSRLRRLRDHPVPTRMRGAGNPGGEGHEWVKARFVEQARNAEGSDHKELYRRRIAGEELGDRLYRNPPSQEETDHAAEFGRDPRGAVFIPAYAEDNQALVLEEYAGNLAKLTSLDALRLRHGDWDAIESGDFFKPESFKYLEAEPAGVRWIRYWDLAATVPKKGDEAKETRGPAWSAGVRVGIQRQPDGKKACIIADSSRDRRDPGGVENLVRATAELDGKTCKVWMEQEPGSAGVNNIHNYASRVLFGWPFEGHKKTGPKEEFWKGLSALASHGLLYLVRGEWNAAFVRELCGLPNGKKDQADAASGGLAVLLEHSGADRTHALANL